MATNAPTVGLLRDSGEPRPRASRRTDAITAGLALWFTVGLFLDAYAHANLPHLETFFTPWHAVFYSGFAATAGWILWTVRRHVREGRRGMAAVPHGYGMTLIALPVFAISGAVDLVWHEVFGIESGTDIFFSPSHLGLITAMVVILTTPVRAAWSDPDLPARPTLRAVWPAVVTLAFSATLVLLFLTYGSALVFDPDGIVRSFDSVDEVAGGAADMLAARMVVTTLVLLAPLLLLARRWPLPAGSATIGYAAAALISSLLAGFENAGIALATVAAGVLVDVLAAGLRPGPDRTGAFRAFAFAAPLLTWTVVLGTASVAVGRLPGVTELWTGAPIVMALVGLLLAVLMTPSAERVPAVNG